jgi:hypothetical protein
MAGTVRFVSPSQLLFLVLLLDCGGSDKPAESPAPPTNAAPSASAEPSGAAEPSATEAAAAAAGAPATSDVWPFSGQTPAERKEQLDRLAKDAGPIRTNWVPPGKKERYGRAEGIIAAPIDKVRAKLQDFGSYKDLAGPKFKTVRVVDKQGDDTHVYFQLPIMKGLITINYVTRFAPIKGDVIEGKFVKGNIKDMHVVWTVRPGPDEKSAIMTCDLLLVPHVPAPQDAVDEELRDACGDAINAVRKTLGASP